MEEQLEHLRKENYYLKQLMVKMMHNHSRIHPGEIVTKKSPLADKIAIFKSLFTGRTDFYALRWESKKGGKGYAPACALEWQKPICQKPDLPCNQCQHRKLLPLTDQVLIAHINGKKTIGIYPLLQDNTCTFLAVDFDKKQWQQDVLAFSETCKNLKIPYHIERSRSGNGAHVWIFFSSAIFAATARRLGRFLLKKTKEQNDGFTLESFDRMFPNQDALEEGGFGNLIALPLQKGPGQKGNSLFIDEHFIPYPDQWLYLSTVRKMTEEEIRTVIREEMDEPVTPPEVIQVELKKGIHIKQSGIPSSLVSQITDIASFNNPEFYKAQAKRFSTQGIPRTIQSAYYEQDNLVLPRGSLEKLLDLLKKQSIKVEIIDRMYEGEGIAVDFHGKLSSQQSEVVDTLVKDNHGTLSATTGFGKTVVATAIIAKRKVSTLIIVHRTQLMKQWVERLANFLNVSPKEIGQIGGGKNHITRKVDVATIQSLNYGGQLKSFITQYGQIIVDECHIISAVTFENILKQIRPKYVLGLTATPKRKDGMHPIITMQCGPIRCKIDAKSQAKVRPFGHRLITRKTQFTTKKTEFHDIYEELTADEAGNLLIFDDVLKALEEGRCPIILTERLEHLETLKKQFNRFAKNIIVLAGNMKKKDQKKELERLAKIPDNEERLIIATGKYIGEGFDDSRLDTLFLTMPISWTGTLKQYVGRLHREYEGKQEVQVYDYVDEKVPILKAMYEKRLSGYNSMGYVLGDGKHVSEQMKLF
ncbi:TOTE conflict system archaeo-eukaryotic primase domain-containing protein [Neobacillus niacini]|uniref:TOTE conflict system archaeo-eukaryotic primase domain-containing protein n=1 Tax=Neobacillus niacini TaxID=86668 RepID=UPI00286426A1|nr:DEAD/DEAH box helicase family protein [Neobacillus niacini]MDR6998953.1 superfamily II DNA or RNA helicase [Neobacillus niacini]